MASTRHLLGGLVVLVSLGCSDDRSTAGPRVDDPLPADVEVGADAPADLSYVCGHRFLVSNAHSVPIRVTYRMAGDLRGRRAAGRQDRVRIY